MNKYQKNIFLIFFFIVISFVIFQNRYSLGIKRNPSDCEKMINQYLIFSNHTMGHYPVLTPGSSMCCCTKTSLTSKSTSFSNQSFTESETSSEPSKKKLIFKNLMFHSFDVKEEGGEKR